MPLEGNSAVAEAFPDSLQGVMTGDPVFPREDYYRTNIPLLLRFQQIHHRRWIQVAVAAVIFPHRFPCFKRHQDQVERQRQRQPLAIMQIFTLVAAGRFQIDAEETRQAAQIPLNRAAIFDYIPAACKDEGGIAPVMVVIWDEGGQAVFPALHGITPLPAWITARRSALAFPDGPSTFIDAASGAPHCMQEAGNQKIEARSEKWYPGVTFFYNYSQVSGQQNALPGR